MASMYFSVLSVSANTVQVFLLYPRKSSLNFYILSELFKPCLMASLKSSLEGNVRSLFSLRIQHAYHIFSVMDPI